MIREELIPRENDRLICVKCGKIKRENSYEMARKYWVVNGRRAKMATHVLVVIDGIVDTVYTDCVWTLTDNPDYKNRWEFTARECTDSSYIGKSVKSYYGRSQNPIKYINL